jgi:two-component system OmpR family response regulator
MKRDEPSPIRVAGLTLTPGDPRVQICGQRVVLRAQELALLELLVGEVGRLISTATIIKHLTRGPKPLSDIAVAVYVHRLRTLIRPAGLAITRFRGFGYCLEPADRAGTPRGASVRSEQSGR